VRHCRDVPQTRRQGAQQLDGQRLNLVGQHHHATVRRRADRPRAMGAGTDLDCVETQARNLWTRVTTNRRTACESQTKQSQVLHPQVAMRRRQTCRTVAIICEHTFEDPEVAVTTLLEVPGQAELALADEEPRPPMQVAEAARRGVAARIPQKRKASMGQFMTPEAVARRIASMVDPRPGVVRLLDAGAGVGALTAATVEHLLKTSPRPERIEITAFELDSALADALEHTLTACRRWAAYNGVEVSYKLRREDFLLAVVDGTAKVRHDVAVLNPPYRKLRASSELHTSLATAGLESTNLYTAFWAAAVRLASVGAQVVAITPRSFCNGTYFQKFRGQLLEASAIRKVHVYESRQTAFADDEVLQEVVITALSIGHKQESVQLSVTTGPNDASACGREVAFQDIVHADDPAQFIRLPSAHDADEVRKTMLNMPHTLPELGLTVSTGRVVDFRAREHLQREPSRDTVPLIYPSHLRDGVVRWPLAGFKKHNALDKCPLTASLLVPNGVYLLVRRFSAKEERRRVTAAVYDGALDTDSMAFENHLNYFHHGGAPLEEFIGSGLCVYLNSTFVDDFVRQFNGHTQVNAGDLRSLRYPSREDLGQLAKVWRPGLPQDEIDAAVYALSAR